MSRQGHVVFLALRAAAAKKALRRVPFSTAILGSNDAWTALVPVDAPKVDWTEHLGALGAVLVELWFDEDSSIELRWRRLGCSEDRLTIHFGGAFQKSDANESFLGFAGPFEDKPKQAQALRKLLTLPVRTRDEKLRAHALEELLAFPVLEPPPFNASLDMLRSDWPKLTLVHRDEVPGPAPTLDPTQIPCGRSFHLRRGVAVAREGLARLDGRVAILASSRAWTTLFPLDPGFDAGRATADLVLRCDLLETHFDVTRGVRYQVHRAGANPGSVLQVGWGQPFVERGMQRVFYLHLEGWIPKPKVKALRDRLHDPIAKRDRWLMARGLETALQLPEVEPVLQSSRLELLAPDEMGYPTGLPGATQYDAVAAEALKMRWPQLEIVAPTRATFSPGVSRVR